MGTAKRISSSIRIWYRVCCVAIASMLANLAAWGATPPPGL
jgi:hypothetical protein